MRLIEYALMGLVAIAVACPPKNARSGGIGQMKLVETGYESLSGWDEGEDFASVKAIADSCRAILDDVVSDPPEPPPLYQDGKIWKDTCRALLGAIEQNELTTEELRALLETHFKVYQVEAADGNRTGLFTGYFEPVVSGSLVRQNDRQVPLYRKPPSDDLRRQTRAAISAGGLDGQGLELVWIDNPVDAFFLDIQGSAAIKLATGETRRIRYTAFNGFPYFAIGRKLIDWGEVSKEKMSMQAIIDWMANHPSRMQELMNHNTSYVYFDWIEKTAPQGSQGTDLTAGYSLAIDPRYIPYGTPIWLQTTHPQTGEALNRLVMGQDKGGAIKGEIRGDLFWGTGAAAATLAGHMKQQGAYYVLLPKALDIPQEFLAQ